MKKSVVAALIATGVLGIAYVVFKHCTKGCDSSTDTDCGTTTEATSSDSSISTIIKQDLPNQHQGDVQAS